MPRRYPEQLRSDDGRGDRRNTHDEHERGEGPCHRPALGLVGHHRADHHDCAASAEPLQQAEPDEDLHRWREGAQQRVTTNTPRPVSSAAGGDPAGRSRTGQPLAEGEPDEDGGERELCGRGRGVDVSCERGSAGRYASMARAGSAVSAPSRTTLRTGRARGATARWGSSSVVPWIE
ncbi:MAG: hypothetical protein M3Q27_15880 [Actinomycetota bacterium]|nr:hypothetical protein [Actinomycetota bacterium]